jgi:hypothetical protein
MRAGAIWSSPSCRNAFAFLSASCAASVAAIFVVRMPRRRIV